MRSQPTYQHINAWYPAKNEDDDKPGAAEALESVCQQPQWVELLSKFTEALSSCCVLQWDTTQSTAMTIVRAVCSKKVQSCARCAAVRRGKEVGGEHETEPTKIFKHIRGMAVYLNTTTGQLVFCWFLTWIIQKQYFQVILQLDFHLLWQECTLHKHIRSMAVYPHNWVCLLITAFCWFWT